MNHNTEPGRRAFLRTGGAALTTSLLAGPNGRRRWPAKAGAGPKLVKDFRDVLADKSIDAVRVSTPDHWHAYMTVEACKAGKDVHVEKPASAAVEEGRKMVEAARKYKRGVQVGSMSRSSVLFRKAAGIVRGGQLGKIQAVRTGHWTGIPADYFGSPPDSDPPPGLDWDLWLGPAPKRPFNQNRFGVNPSQYGILDPNQFPAGAKWSSFRYFWDYAGGDMTDNGAHHIDIIQMCFDEAAPVSAAAIGGKFRLKDNRETPDTLDAMFEYPGFAVTFEVRLGNTQNFGAGSVVFFGDRGTLSVSRKTLRVLPERGSDLKPLEETVADVSDANRPHWANFLECMRTRQMPVADIEAGHRSAATCHLGNIAYRSRLRIDWDSEKETIRQAEARKYQAREYRSPWKLVV
ncbi:MAG: Gfo/Idh/MocA family oxidoreductase [Bryobacterales bacterium]|nr:Gfo/Idh/MocA family oxidoreductase [Bryobacterales bacterium]